MITNIWNSQLMSQMSIIHAALYIIITKKITVRTCGEIRIHCEMWPKRNNRYEIVSTRNRIQPWQSGKWCETSYFLHPKLNRSSALLEPFAIKSGNFWNYPAPSSKKKKKKINEIKRNFYANQHIIWLRSELPSGVPIISSKFIAHFGCTKIIIYCFLSILIDSTEIVWIDEYE